MAQTGKIKIAADNVIDADSLVRMRVLATTDLHAHLFPFNYYTDRRDDGVGLARAASLIGELRADIPNCLLLDNGDTLQGAPLGDAAQAEILPQGRPHPMIAAMNALGYDAATLGNHDFDYGISFLNRSIAGAVFPVVLANARRRDGAPLLPGHVMLTRVVQDHAGMAHSLRIGVIGVAPPQIAQWAGAVLGGDLVMEDMLSATQREVAALQAARADVVIVLAHSGLGTVEPGPGAENAAVAISRISGVNAVVAGHSHSVHAGAVAGGAPIVQPGFWGSHVGVVDLTLTRTRKPVAPRSPDVLPILADGFWSVTGVAPSLRALSSEGAPARMAFRKSLRKVPRLRAQMAKDHRMTRRFSGRPLGAIDQPLETFFSQLAPCAALTLMADAKRCHAERLIEGRPDLARLPMVVTAAPSKAGGRGGPLNYTDIPAGPLRLRHAADLYVYPNTLVVLRASGTQIRAWLERVASAFHQITPDPLADPATVSPTLLLDRRFAGYNFDTMDGLRYAFDLSQPALTSADGEAVIEGPGRVRDLRLADGTPLRAQDEVLLVTNSYRAEGGGHFPAAAAAEPVMVSADSVRDVVASHISSRPVSLTVVPRPTWRFTPLGGAPVLVETGPGALFHPARIAELGLVEMGLTSSGFQQFRWTI